MRRVLKSWRAVRLFAGASVMAAAALAPGPALAIRAPREAAKDAKRFGLDQASRAQRRLPSRKAAAAFTRFNGAHGGAWKIRFDGRTGLPSAVVGGASAPRPGRPEDAARAFLSEQREVLGVDPAALSVMKTSGDKGLRHVLYRQTYRGLPVEFSRVKVHLDENGAVLGVHSSFEPDAGLDVTPTVSASQAAETVRADLGAGPEGRGELVVFPDQNSGRTRLAWKFSARGTAALWRYYVDAHTGELLFRYNDMRFVSSAFPNCLTSGTIQGLVYDIDPGRQVAAAARPFAHARVYVVDGSTYSDTYYQVTKSSAFYCNGNQGRIFTQLQGPYVSVSNFRGPNAHYDNGGGVWKTVATPVASPNPYPYNYDNSWPVDISASIAPDLAVKVMPIFFAFQVGEVGGGGYFEANDLIDDDELMVVDPFGNAVGGYYGTRSPFRGAGVPGTQYILRLVSNDIGGPEAGFEVRYSSYMVFSADPHSKGPSNDLIWDPAAHSFEGKRGETNVFYHLNRMHDFFTAGVGTTYEGTGQGVDYSNAADINSRSVNAVVFLGPNLSNPFYNPARGNLNFGDNSGSADPSVPPNDDLTDDSTVPRHEYVHYVVDKIWPIQNLSQAGAISEAMSDYFTASSLNLSSIGYYFNRTWGAPLRELDCHNESLPWDHRCYKLCPYPGASGCTPWAGQVHSDGIYLSQALWDLRRDLMNMSASHGQACADSLVFQALLFFPESFDEFLDAMKTVERLGSIKQCTDMAAAGSLQTAIGNKFADHGLPIPALTDNAGFQTAVDVSTQASVSAAIYPAGDRDYYTFAAGPGQIRVTLSLPSNQPPDGYFKGYCLTLYDHDHTLVGLADPPYNGVHTYGGFCDDDDCSSTHNSVELAYENPSPGQFYLEVSGGSNGWGISGVNSTSPYGLTVVRQEAGALSASVEASFDRDALDFTVHVTSFSVHATSFTQTPNYIFSYAQLRDHAKQVIPNTRTDMASSYLTWLSSRSLPGEITGRVRLATGSLGGFSQRFPSVGTIHLEVFAMHSYYLPPSAARPNGYLVTGSTVSLGLSNPIMLTSNQSALTAYNNIFNPLLGHKATIKADIQEAGHYSLKIYTLSGRLVATIFDGELPAGKASADWYGQNLSGAKVASGIYLIRLSGPGISQTQKIVVVK